MSVTKTCDTCGTLFDVPERRQLTARFCSNACRAAGVGAMLKGKPLSEEHRAKVSAATAASWASGTRKANPREGYEKASHSIREGYASGRLSPPRPFTAEKAKQAAAKRDPNWVRTNCSRTGKLKFGKPNPPGPSELGPRNQFSKYWELHGPNGEFLRGLNLSELVRQNEHLFDARDLDWNRAWTCRATKRLRQLFQAKLAPKSWKGWTAGLHADEEPNY